MCLQELVHHCLSHMHTWYSCVVIDVFGSVTISPEKNNAVFTSGVIYCMSESPALVAVLNTCTW